MDVNGNPIRIDTVGMHDYASPLADNLWTIEPIKHLCNHHCSPNLMDAEDADRTFQGFNLHKTYAARDIEVGEELCFDYCLEYYDNGPFFSPCLCGAPNCRGSFNGFVALTHEQKLEILPIADEFIQQRYKESIQHGRGESLPARL